MAARRAPKRPALGRSEPTKAEPTPSSAQATARCVICGALLAPAARPPFCSQRCALIDLSRWLDGSYRLPTTEHEAHAGELDLAGSQEHPCDD